MTPTLIAALICLLGILAHWGQAYFQAKTDVPFLSYIFTEDPFGTLKVVTAVIASATAMVTQTALDPCTIEGAIALFGVGYAFDSVLNTDGKQKVKNE